MVPQIQTRNYILQITKGHGLPVTRRRGDQKSVMVSGPLETALRDMIAEYQAAEATELPHILQMMRDEIDQTVRHNCFA